MSKSTFKTTSRSSITTNFSTILGVTLVLTTIGLMSLLFFSAKGIGDGMKSGIEVQVMLNDDFPENEVIKSKKLLQGKRFTQEVIFVSKIEAAAEHVETLGEDFVEFLGENPLPASFRVHLQPNYTEPDSLDWIVAQLQSNIGVREVVYQPDLFASVVSNISKVTIGLAILMAFLLFISVALINNTIRLAVFSKRFIIKSMQLVGATAGFIRRPFIWTGIGIGLFSSILAIGIISGLLYVSRDGELSSITQIIVEKNYYIPMFGLILVMGVLISWVSTHFAVSKFIRLRQDQLY